jgi:Raf kinase inhibitor-like YbhB/YbcL family protein
MTVDRYLPPSFFRAGLSLIAAAALAAFPVSAWPRTGTEGDMAMAFKLTSSAFTHQDEIPSRYTCDGQDISPPLAWSGVPSGARSLVLIMDDPDAPDPAAPKMTWVHWLVYNIPPDSTGLPEDADKAGLPQSAREGTNNFRRKRYGGPCPPIGRHRYFLKLYALDTVLPDLDAPDKDELLDAMQGHVLEETQLMGTYQH